MKATCIQTLVVAFFAIGVPNLVACGSNGEEAVMTSGSLQLPLTGYSRTGSQYRLRDASFRIQGAASRTVTTETDPDASNILVELPIGNYTSTLRPGWRLERLVGASFEPVDAALLSENPVSFAIQEGVRTRVLFRFRAGTDVIDVGNGEASIEIEVDDGAPCPGLNYICGSGATRGCGAWGFESRTTEGWFVGNEGLGFGPTEPPSAWDGALEATTARATDGAASLVFGFDNGTGSTSGIHGVTVGPRLCPDDDPAHLTGTFISFDLFVESDPSGVPFPGNPSQNAHYFRLTSPLGPIGTCDFSVPEENVWQTVDCEVFWDISAFELIFRVFPAWRGQVFVDNARLH